ncbi:MAG: hypothetical protein EXS35_17330 [Pedosphaera sp.]|nr:hypothetical protein [Pedosphaera sp.]
MLQLLRSNPGLAISFVLLGGGALASTLMGFFMARSGASLRPVYWFAGLFALVVVPQLAGHFYIALRTTKAEAPRTASLEQIAQRDTAESTTTAGDAKALFGPDADPQLITDARNLPGGVFSAAELAQFAPLPDGGTVLLARFKGSLAAEKAWIEYLRTTGLNQLKGTGDSQRGYVVTRPVGDRAYVLHFGTMVGVWTGKDDTAIRERMVAGGFEIPRHAPLNASTPALTANAPASKSTPKNPLTPGLIGAGIALYVLVVVLYFFKGAAWAGTSPAKPGGAPVTATELAARLEAVNTLDVPFRIERGAQPNEFFATWRYADAKWVDLARARGMKRTFRIRLTLDEKHGTVRATDYVASFDWSAGRGGAEVEWKTGLGIVFFQYEHQRVFGLQLDEQGRFKPELSYAYTFNLNEMKSPLITAVNHAGWNWRPTVWQGPAWLRWLTE